jgi:putative transposase
VDSLKNQTVSKENYTPEARKYRGLFKSVIGYINADVNGARNILKRFKKKWFDKITGIGKIIRVMVFGKLKSSPEAVRVYGQIGVARCGAKSIDLGERSEQHLSGIRLHQCSNLSEKPPTNRRFEHTERYSTLVGV